jgi:hypothetical protein
MWKKGKNLVYLYEKLSILSIGGARLIFMNSSKCPTKSLIKKWDLVMSSSCACFYSFSQYKRILACLDPTAYNCQRTSKANGQNSSKWTGPLVGLPKTLKNGQNVEAKFLKNISKFLYKRGYRYRSHFLHQIVATP